MDETLPPDSPLAALIVPRSSDLGDGFTVLRALPARQCRMVGPFVFFDQMGPTVLAPGRGLDVRPHPHIGLATVTYLFSGEILHRDSLGFVQPIRPAEVNWMTAGRGIVHSERTAPELRSGGMRLYGIQSWVALPKAHEETEPAFVHYGSADLPLIEAEGVRLRLIVGSLHGQQAGVATLWETIYADAEMQPGAGTEFPAQWDERAFYVVEGSIEVNGAPVGAGQLAVLKAGVPATATAGPGGARVMLLGGEPMDGPREIWWNLVSSSHERIVQAREDWQAGRFPQVPGETEFIPLPAYR